MFLRYDAVLNGASLASIAPEIIVRDIVELPPNVERQTATRALHHGTRLSNAVRRSLSVRIIFVVRAYDGATRTSILDQIADWAGDGGWLTITDRPNQRLYVHTDDLPHLDSALKWTQDLSMTLTAYERPYWEAVSPVTATITESGTITPIGTVRESFVECDMMNTGSGDLTTITVNCGDTFITLEGLSVPSGEKVAIMYTDDDLLTITAAGVSALGNRTAESHDDLIAYTRVDNAISVSADQPVSAVFAARGRWL